MKLLVIPDVHLKPNVIYRAINIMEELGIDQSVCLMDIADDWNQDMNIEQYCLAYGAAIELAENFPSSLWCIGNHDISYEWECHESGYSSLARTVVNANMDRLRETVEDPKQVAFLHRIDNCIFSHAGLAEEFVNAYVPKEDQDNIDQVIETINGFGSSKMWKEISPILYRPQRYSNPGMYKEDEYLQIVGHTPVKKITKIRNYISCDVFSTYSNGTPIGNQKYILLDTLTQEYEEIDF